MPNQPGDFAFLAGEWAITHRWKPTPDTPEWDVFAGEATCWSILNEAGSVEELRIPARQFSGMGLRLLDREQNQWSDFWVNARSGVLSTPGMQGHFIDGVGIFESEEQEEGRITKIRAIWDQITPTSCRWRQAISTDGGETWIETWIMEWQRV
jgi:hypothetical protein